MSAEGGRGPRHSVPRASVVNIGGDFSTVVLVDINNRPIMNLHKVPQHVCVSNVKKKISDRLREVGRNLPADLMILKFGEQAEIEMENDKPLNMYNTMGLSRIQIQISKRQKFDINIVVIKRVGIYVCCSGNKVYVHKENRSRRVHVPSLCPKYLLREATPGLSAKEARQSAIRMEIARRMNCNVDRHELELFFDPELQEHIIVEGTCRARGITENSTVYTKCPPNFDVNNLAPLDIPRQAYAKKAEVEVEGEPAAEPKPTEDILTDSTEAEEDKTEAKTALQIDFEKTAGKSLAMSSQQAGEFARKLGYSPSAKDLAALPAQVDYKAFQNFLTSALHTEDLAENFQRFFSIFDIQATGDLSAKQLCNIVQMYGNEPLTKAEAEKFTKIIMAGADVVPIKVVVDSCSNATLGKQQLAWMEMRLSVSGEWSKDRNSSPAPP